MKSLVSCLVVLVAGASLADEFRWNDETGDCRDAQGRQGWNAGGAGQCADLRNASLDGASFTSSDLRGARLDGAQLRRASLQKADLRGASLVGADLSDAVLIGAQLQGAKLDGAVLVKAHLEHAKLAGAHLPGADLRLAALFATSFEQTDLRGARFSQTRALLDGARWYAAIIDASTQLPFTADDLAARSMTVDGTASVARR